MTRVAFTRITNTDTEYTQDWGINSVPGTTAISDNSTAKDVFMWGGKTNRSLQFDINDTSATYVGEDATTEFSTDADLIFMRFAIKLGSTFTLASGGYFNILRMKNASGSAKALLRLYGHSDGTIRVYSRLKGSTWQNYPSVVTDRPVLKRNVFYQIEVQWRSNYDAIDGDGGMAVWINGETAFSLWTVKGTTNEGMKKVEFGPTSIASGSGGSYWVDNFIFKGASDRSNPEDDVSRLDIVPPRNYSRLRSKASFRAVKLP